MTGFHEYSVRSFLRKIITIKWKQSLGKALLILSTTLGALSEKNCSVSWDLTTVPIFFGDNIPLKCTATGNSDCFGSGIFKWIGGPKKEVISFDVRVFDRTKYTAYHDKGKYLLVIKNVTAKDLDVSYACHCGFYNLTRILKNVSTIHPNDKVDVDQRNTPGDNHDQEKTGNVSSIAGLVVGAIACVLAISIGYAIYKRRNRNDRNKTVEAGSNEMGTHENLITVNPGKAPRI